MWQHSDVPPWCPWLFCVSSPIRESETRAGHQIGGMKDDDSSGLRDGDEPFSSCKDSRSLSIIHMGRNSTMVISTATKSRVMTATRMGSQPDPSCWGRNSSTDSQKTADNWWPSTNFTELNSDWNILKTLFETVAVDQVAQDDMDFFFW